MDKDSSATRRPPRRGRSALASATAVVAGLGLVTVPVPAGAVVGATGTVAAVRPVDGVFRMVGRGWGHGRGMSQWGAYAAARAGRTYAEILRFYYPGTRLVRGNASAQIRVRLSHGGGEFRVRPEPGLTVWWTRQNGRTQPSTLPTQLAGCRVSTWRVLPVGGRDMAVQGYSCGTWRTYVPASRLLGTGRVSFVPTDGRIAVERKLSDGTRTRRGYRGFVRVLLRDGRLRPVNVVPYEEYLRSVVPSESPASWPRAALRAQAVAARSYAVRSASGRASSYFDVYDTTASQAYPGVVRYSSSWGVARTYEHARTTTAIRSTRALTLRYGGRVAFTEFGSSNGGWTANGGRPYLRAARDAWDLAVRAPNSRWSDTVTASRLQARYPSIGTLAEIRVRKRAGGGQWGGRVTSLLLVGSNGAHVVSGEDNVRWALGVRSAWFAFRT